MAAFGTPGFFAQDLQQMVASALNVKIKRATVRLNYDIGGVAYQRIRIANPELTLPASAGASISEDMRRMLLDSLSLPEARTNNMQELLRDWDRFKVSTQAFDLVPVTDYEISHPKQGKKDAGREGATAVSGVDYQQDGRAAFIALSSTVIQYPPELLMEMWEASTRIIASVIGETGTFYAPLFDTGVEVKVDFTPEMTTGLYVMSKMREKVAASLVGKSIISALATDAGRQLWGLARFDIAAEMWVRAFSKPSQDPADDMTKILVNRMFLDTLPYIEPVIKQEYEFNYVQGRKNNVSDQAVRVLMQSVDALKLIEPLPIADISSGSMIDHFRITSLSNYWKFIGSLDPYGIDYMGTGFNMAPPEGALDPKTVIGGLFEKGLEFSGETADILLPTGVSKTRSDPGFYRTTAAPEQLATLITMHHPWMYKKPDAADDLIKALEEAYIKGQSPRNWEGQLLARDEADYIIIDAETTKDGGRVPAFTRQVGYNIKVTSPASDCVQYEAPIFAQPELDNLMVSYQMQTVNFRTWAPFMLS